MSQPFPRERQVAVWAVREAALLCEAVQRQITPDALEKKDRSPVTVADFGSQALICRALAEAFADDPVMAEEDSVLLRQPENAALWHRVTSHVRAIRPEADQAKVCRWIDHGAACDYEDRFWTLDPLDGTKGFLRGEQYAISLALIVKGEIEVAVLACPSLVRHPHQARPRGAIFVASRGQGASCLPMNAQGRGRPIRVSDQDDPALARFCESVESGHSAHDDAANVAARLQIDAPPLRLDSQAKYAVVARGEADIYLRLPTRLDYRESIWDHAGGALIVTEAGGKVSDVAGRALELRHGRRLEANRGVIATNGRLHDRVLAALGELDAKKAEEQT